MQLRVTVTQGDLQGYIIQSQGQSVIKKKKKNLACITPTVIRGRNGSDHLPFMEENRESPSLLVQQTSHL